ncbi:MAG TPA: hypothetical protein VMD30_01145 [Tepidisphaeraceae bacterium]|nr:hypothetical protein [Tepidisphaeraceae bacterium]
MNAVNGLPRIVIAGVGNEFGGDDPFGSELLKTLSRLDWPEGVRVADYGLRDVDLTYALAEDADVAIFLETVEGGNAGGAMQVLRAETDNLSVTDDRLAPRRGTALAERLVRMARALGGKVRDALLVECEKSPQKSGTAETARKVKSLVAGIRAGEMGRILPGNVDRGWQ